MKRNELTCGMEVEVQRSRQYAFSNDRAIVLDTQPWQDARITRFGPHRYQRTGKGTGVAVAIEQGTSWVPRVVQLSQLVPVGTREEWKRQRRENLEREREARREVQRRHAQLVQRLGLNPDGYEVHMPGYGSSVTLPTKVLEGLLDEVEQLRNEVQRHEQSERAIAGEIAALRARMRQYDPDKPVATVVPKQHGSGTPYYIVECERCNVLVNSGHHYTAAGHAQAAADRHNERHS